MIDETVVVLEPQNPKDVEHVFDMEDLVREVAGKLPDLISGQFRFFPYLRCHSSIGLTGLVYTLGEKDNPLATVDSQVLIQAFEGQALAVGATINAHMRGGHISKVCRNDEDYVDMLNLSLDSKFEHFDLQKPKQRVKRFIVNLDPEAFTRVVIPYLQSRKYGDIQTQKFK